MRILPEELPDNFIPKVTAERKTNRLAKEKSPYLLQHAHNPVDWYTWGEEAFAKALREDKPIFLSIGYSTCYWCHVMEREVFENKSIADLMNVSVVSIKLDREERPDIDQVYMTALQGMTGSGGWPISIFMTPDRKPFFAGTYIPPKGAVGSPGFIEILNRINKLWINDRSKVLESSEKVSRFLLESAEPKESISYPNGNILDNAFLKFSESYDASYGGFGIAPKFPNSGAVNFLFRYFKRTGNIQARDMALNTLKKMAAGGMYDQIGGGFHRYSTDEKWHLPHFEKMLYDQAQLIISYLEAFQVTHDKTFSDTAYEILTYVRRELMHPGGGFYSAQDAESIVDNDTGAVKKEGAYYLWKKEEIERILTKKEAAIAEYVFGIKENGNIRPDPRNEFLDENILSVNRSLEEAAKKLGERIEIAAANFDLAKIRLFEERNRRPKPDLDDKILLSWNGLMISAFARASQVLGDESYLLDAAAAAEFLLDKLFNKKTNLLFRRYRDGESKYGAVLKDYAFLVQAFLDLYESSFDIEWLKKAVEFTDAQINLFYDTDKGGFFEVSGMDTTVPVKSKDISDGSEPSGNSISIMNLLRLSEMLGKSRYRDMALKSLDYFSAYMQKAPQVLPQLLAAYDFSLSKPVQIVFSGNRKHPVICDMEKEIHKRYIPSKILLLADSFGGGEYLSRHVPYYETILLDEDGQKAYVCENYHCELPASELQALVQILDKKQDNLS